jgi:hypothetical protein
VTAQIHGQNLAIGQGVLGKLAELLPMAGDTVHADDR